ncbi:hypothetical protein [Facklamia miroungae]|uniref:Uncharacterized protein n=1 Tax=Facklamia miroungae TaxID=120956 RepID=A0A1G7P935_9LACT|nr:hypothetical protein [Facklamia miroungae]NKZ28626.1 hypothetical protein [Facklamia miroungae]SDF82802.1 hypothetical protein SAMN05421791_101167 [Facklamia miroungae]
MKNLMIILSVIFQIIETPVINAQKGELAYTNIPSDQNFVSLEACQILLRETPMEDSINESNSDLQRQFEANQVRMTAINERYQILTKEILAIQEGPSNSLSEANLALEEVIESLYQSFSIQQEDFISLSAEQQLALISQDQTVIEWQAYIEELNQIIDQYVREQADLEAEYQQLLYDNETLSEQLQTSKETIAQRNQCQLYPYSASAFPIDHDNLQLNTSDLPSLIVSIDDYFKNIVPKAYSKVTFQQIFDLFSQELTLEELNRKLAEKHVVHLDDSNFELYQYAKELSLFDIETLASQSLRDYYASNNQELYHAAFTNLLNLKESQMQYFYIINTELFENIKLLLADFLNSNGLISEEIIEQIKTLHDRYQMKLVLYNENTQTWSANLGAHSGYLDEYSAKTLIQTHPQAEPQPDPLNDSSDHNDSSDQKDNFTTPLKKETKDPGKGLLTPNNKKLGAGKDQKDNLAYLKDKLASKPNAKKVNNIAKPTDQEKNKVEDKVNKEGSLAKSKLLPTTGEQKFYLYLAWIMLMIGLIALIINRCLKQHRKKQYIQKNFSRQEERY